MPRAFVACKHVAKIIFFSEFQEENDMNHPYLTTPKRIV